MDLYSDIGYREPEATRQTLQTRSTTSHSLGTTGATDALGFAENLTELLSHHNECRSFAQFLQNRRSLHITDEMKSRGRIPVVP